MFNCFIISELLLLVFACLRFVWFCNLFATDFAACACAVLVFQVSMLAVFC